MTNIISLHGKPFASVLPSPPETWEVVHSLRALWVSGIIGRDAYSLGTHVIAMCQHQRTRVACVTHEDASQIVVKAGGSILTGPVSGSRTDFITALQELHFSARIINHYDANRLDDHDVNERHFTRNPDIGADGLWSHKTPIHFRLPEMEKKLYEAGIAELFQSGIAHCKGSLQIKLQG